MTRNQGFSITGKSINTILSLKGIQYNEPLDHIPSEVKNIKIMILPWLNEEHAMGGMNKDNLTISLQETKQRWRIFIEQLSKFPLLERLLKILQKSTTNIKQFDRLIIVKNDNSISTRKIVKQ